MQQLTPAGDTAIRELSRRYGVSVDAVSTLLAAVAAGGGSMAQFYHSELGGGGQWMRGGMTMVGDMFNSGLQSLVNGLCSELSTLLGSTQVFAASPGNNGVGSGSNHWWPAELGSPSSSGGQNNSRYAYFPSTRRLAVETDGQLAIYDTLDHQIGGVQQQQGGAWGSFSFSSQFGTFTVESLPRVNGPSGQNNTSYAPTAEQPTYQQPSSQTPTYQPATVQEPAPHQSVSHQRQAEPFNNSGVQSSGDVLAAIERLGQLFNQGMLTNDEFQSKKAELLSRL